MAEIHLVETENESSCQLWVGVTRNGQLSCSQLIDMNKVPLILHEAALQGATVKPPLLLSDVRKNSFKNIYLAEIPYFENKSNSLESLETWVEELCRAVEGFSSQDVGFYLSPEILGEELSHTMLNNILQKLLLNRKIKQYSLLIGTHGINSLLDLSLKIKAQVAQKNVHLTVYH